MAGRSRDTYKKRQKEVARAEKARDKAARRIERKLRPRDPITGELIEENEEVIDGVPGEAAEGAPSEASSPEAPASERTSVEPVTHNT